MNLTYRENYCDSPELKSQFIAFLKLVHGVDLSSWDKMGFWDRLYRPFSYFDGDSLVSNVCVYSMNMTVNGESLVVAQISAVGTLPNYRRQGLSSDLTQKALDWAGANHDFFYLFADADAFGFYKKHDFRPVIECKTRISVSEKAALPGAVKLDIHREDHLALMYRFASERVPVSDVLGVSNKKLLMFWLLNSLQEHIYHIPELEILIIYKRTDRLTTIFDIIGKHIPSFSQIHAYICSENDKTYEFLFMTDKLNLKNTSQAEVEDNGTHVMGNFPLKNKQFIFPFTGQA